MSLYSGPELDKNQANFAPLTPVSVLKRTERVYPDLPAQVHGSIRRSWGEVAERCKRLASALSQRGVIKGDTVALIATICEFPLSPHAPRLSANLSLASIDSRVPPRPSSPTR